DVVKLDLATAQAKYAVDIADRDQKLKQEADRAVLANSVKEAALAAKERLQKELESKDLIVAEREKAIVEINTKFNEKVTLALQLDRDLKQSLERNQILVLRNQELERHIAELTQPKAEVASASLKDPTA